MRTRVTPLSSARLVGRARETEILADALGDIGGSRSVIAVSGAAGIGKTRLVTEAVSVAARDGVRVVTVACDEPDRLVPLALVDELVRALHAAGRAVAELPSRALADAGTVDAAAGSDIAREVVRRRVFDGVADALLDAAADEPLLVVAEDLHWSDDASLDALALLARRFVSAPAILLVTFRPEDVHPTLEHLLAHVGRRRAFLEIRLGPLDETAVGRLAEQILGLERPLRRDIARFLTELTDGNPFFVEEILGELVVTAGPRSVDELLDARVVDDLPVPRTVRDALRQRTTGLGPRARRMLTYAAVVGRRIELPLLTALVADDRTTSDGHVSGDDDTTGDLSAPLRELLDAGLLTEVDADTFAFRHELVRRAVSAELLATQRRDLHRRVYATLQRADDDFDVHVADLARHAVAAGAWHDAYAHGVAAGRRALTLHSPRTAATHFTHALEAAARADIVAAAEIHRLRATAHERTGARDAAADDLRTALVVAREQGDRVQEWHALVQLGVLTSGDDYDLAGRHLEDALDVARALGDRRLIAHSLNRVGNWHVNRGRDAEAREHQTEALAIVSELGDVDGLAATHDLLGMTAYAAGELVAARDHFAEAIARFRALDDRVALVNSLSILSLGGGSHMGAVFPPALRLETCASYAQEALSIARDLGWPTGEAFAMANLGAIRAAQGRFDVGPRLLTTSLAMAEELEHQAWIQRTLYFQGLTDADLFRPAEAAALLERATALAEEAGLTLFLGSTLAALAGVRTTEGRLADAEEILARADTLDTSGSAMADRLLRAARVELDLAADEPLRALSGVRALIQATPGDAERAVPLLAWLEGRALRTSGHLVEAAAVLASGADVAAWQGGLPLRWRLLVTGAEVAVQRGDRATATALGTDAAAVLDDMAATLPEDAREPFRQRAAAWRHGEAADLDTLDDDAYGGLTPRQLEVAALVARGLTNREIASELVISPQTAETHVKVILRRLDLDNRTQIAAWATERDLPRVVRGAGD